ncbi:type II toxin-antitoxin system HigB family toxin [Paludibacter sp. 221]|uniref:type II toxin-antitoxin system HigB family toxin n=1 Tax=Paludibacter sp. 221 TaxID=2302939 RepID=UPI0013CFBC47|nr:type II toxin-antitoxin system HigB family toxin [Paludibacter sp. 221]NDV46193.1 type II toxin-antitoxin system HigB family toxin [Paludibacter sp. 221]
MRIIAHRTIVEYSEQQPLAKTALECWYKTAKAAQWKSIQDIKQAFNSVDYVGNKRYVFNIKGNDYRLIVKILFVQQIIYIRFIGTHTEYNKIDCSTI